MKHAALLLFAASLLPLSAFAAGDRYDITIPDMHCEACSSALIGTFSKRAEVESTEANIETHHLTVTLKDHARLSEEEMRKLVKASGFTPEAIKKN